jgi:hypothetical protein
VIESVNTSLLVIYHNTTKYICQFTQHSIGVIEVVTIEVDETGILVLYS